VGLLDRATVPGCAYGRLTEGGRRRPAPAADHGPADRGRNQLSCGACDPAHSVPGSRGLEGRSGPGGRRLGKFGRFGPPETRPARPLRRLRFQVPLQRGAANGRANRRSGGQRRDRHSVKQASRQFRALQCARAVRRDPFWRNLFWWRPRQGSVVRLGFVSGASGLRACVGTMGTRVGGTASPRVAFVLKHDR
jgi:hypothetical protein